MRGADGLGGADGGGAGGIPEAPIDGTTYGRNNAAWVPVAGGGIPEAPNDGEAYARQSLGWTVLELLPLPGLDGDALIVSGGAWTSGALPLLGDVTGSSAASTVARFQGRSFASTAPLDGQVIAWSSGGSTWQPTTIYTLPAPGTAGNVALDNGTAWTSAQLALSQTSGTLPINRGGTGATTAAGARQALLPTPATGLPLVSDGVNDASFTTINIVNATTGTLTTARGGTGLTSSGIRGNVLMSNGSAWTSSEISGLQRIWFQDDFAVGSVAAELGWAYSGNGAANVGQPNNAVIAGAQGHYTLNKGTSATGRAALSFETQAGQLPFVQPWLVGTIIQEWRVYLDILPVALTADFEVGVSLGAGAATTGFVFDSGVGLLHSAASPNWVFESRNATVTIASVNTGVAVPAATWVYIRTEIDAIEARAYIGATKAAATLAGTIPIASVTTTVALGPLAKNRGVAGSVGRNFRIDFHSTEFTLTTSR